MRFYKMLAISFVSLCPVATMATPILDIDSNGQLIGASNINVGGYLYSATFTEGDCFDNFDNCSEDAFFFTTREDALAASAALLAQVFTDTYNGDLVFFDFLPQRIFGCTSTYLCSALTPYELGFGVRYAIANNYVTESLDGLSTGEAGFSLDRDDTVWVVWSASPTQVPEPSTIALVVLGLAGLAFRRKRTGHLLDL